MSTTFDPYEQASQAAAQILDKSGYEAVDLAIVLGSGWKPAADTLLRGADVQEFPMAEFPGFLPPTAEGHGGTLRLATIGSQRVLVLLGRTHPYEGHELWRSVHAVRTAAAAGAKRVVLTNAAGGLIDGMCVGEAVLISDHINFTAKTPLVGARFVNLVDAYSPELRGTMTQLRPGMRQAVYAMMPGPQYETPAEIHMLRTLGAGLVGMSTVYETIASREAGMDVLGISLVTNLAAGMTGEALNHEEVLQAGKDAAEDMGGLLAQLVASL
ncbi:purine-nucleoside phosphorylase [Corynebacterium sp. zg254]|uniref:Purine nucleoside phosphorylase n=1 Tax=Corynebacterium zhongnanshanii TaxID=2768834 RepID=A0ABQ6VEY0_9CORY|nr:MULTISPECIES: purine-nucleoside phosphorylase [Corynebacterium]KAB3522940.1 purine-nucleoside phosphorylase [Corynebacterium zhongnanshanii]MCR5913981.1 purine-nucleoside phosphorylase [Corynebacterium sp. zg254]